MGSAVAWAVLSRSAAERRIIPSAEVARKVVDAPPGKLPVPQTAPRALKVGALTTGLDMPMNFVDGRGSEDVMSSVPIRDFAYATRLMDS